MLNIFVRQRSSLKDVRCSLQGGQTMSTPPSEHSEVICIGRCTWQSWSTDGINPEEKINQEVMFFGNVPKIILRGWDPPINFPNQLPNTFPPGLSAMVRGYLMDEETRPLLFRGVLCFVGFSWFHIGFSCSQLVGVGPSPCSCVLTLLLLCPPVKIPI